MAQGVNIFDSRLPVIAVVDEPKVVYLYMKPDETVEEALERNGFSLVCPLHKWPISRQHCAHNINWPIDNDYGTSYPSPEDFNGRVNRICKARNLGR